MVFNEVSIGLWTGYTEQCLNICSFPYSSPFLLIVLQLVFILFILNYKVGGGLSWGGVCAIINLTNHRTHSDLIHADPSYPFLLEQPSKRKRACYLYILFNGNPDFTNLFRSAGSLLVYIRPHP